MYQNYNYYPQQQQPQNQQIYLRQAPAQQMLLKGRPVTSLEEAKASPIDFDGSISYFPDLGNKCIYTKQINPDGTATLCMYELKQLPINNSAGAVSMDNFVGREEFEKAIAQLRQELSSSKKPEVMSF